MAALQVCLLTPALPEPPIAELAQRLAAVHAIEVTVALTAGDPGGEVTLGDVELAPPAALGERTFDVAIATTWETTAHLFGVRATRHAYRVDELAHHRLAPWQPERVPAALSYDLPVDFLATGEQLAGALRELRPEARCLVVPDGIDKARFAPARDRASDGGPLRILVDGAWSPAAMAERHVLVQSAADADVLVAVGARTGGLPRSVLEAMHAGVPCIALPAAAELVEHLVSGVIAEPDDARGTARWLDTLARDRALLAQLRAGALERAASWPSWEQAAARWAQALEQLVAEEPPADALWPQRLMGDAMAAAALWHNEHHRLAGALRKVEGDEAYRAGQAVRAALDAHPGLEPVRRVARPLLSRGRRRRDRPGR